MAVWVATVGPVWAATPQETYQGIWRIWSEGNAPRAEHRLQEAVLRFPGDARLQLFLAACIASHASDAEADASFEPLVGHAARTDRVCLEALIAEDYLHLGDPEKAPDAFARLADFAQRHDNDPVILWVFAQAALRLHKPALAARAFQSLLRHTKYAPAVVRQAYAEALEAEGRLLHLQERRLVIAQEFVSLMPKRGA